MTHRQVAFCGFLCSLLVGHHAFAGTYSCTAVDKKASVGVADSSSVSITTGDKTCQFSVNGATVSSSKEAAAEFRQQLNRLFDKGLSSFGSSELPALQSLIMGPFKSGQAYVFENTVRSRANDFERCLSSRGQNGFDDSFSGSSCRAYGPGEARRGFHGIAVENDVPILVLSTRVSGQQYILVLPYPLLDAGQAGFRFR